MTTIIIDLQLTPEVDVQNIPNKSDLERWVGSAVSSEMNSLEMCIRLVGTTESQQLNKQYREQDKPTNVLSFPCDLPDGVDIPLVGDLIICEPLVASEAQAQGKSLTAHWAHLVIHGTLHLLGYDHQQEDEALAMESLETKLLMQLGYPNPYES